MEGYESEESKANGNSADNENAEENYISEIDTTDVETNGNVSESEEENLENLESSESQENSDVSEKSKTDENNKFQIIEGDGSEIEISPVSEHLKSMKPISKEDKTKRQIVIPEVRKQENSENPNNV